MLFPISEQGYLNYASINSFTCCFEHNIGYSSMLVEIFVWSVTNSLLLLEYVRSKNLYTTSLSCFSVDNWLWCWKSFACAALVSSSSPSRITWRKFFTPTLQRPFKICWTITCRACFSFAIHFCFCLYLWNIQSHSSPFIFDICPHLIFPGFETMLICSKLLTKIFPFSSDKINHFIVICQARVSKIDSLMS